MRAAYAITILGGTIIGYAIRDLALAGTDSGDHRSYAIALVGFLFLILAGWLYETSKARLVQRMKEEKDAEWGRMGELVDRGWGQAVADWVADDKASYREFMRRVRESVGEPRPKYRAVLKMETPPRSWAWVWWLAAVGMLVFFYAAYINARDKRRALADAVLRFYYYDGDVAALNVAKDPKGLPLAFNTVSNETVLNLLDDECGIQLRRDAALKSGEWTPQTWIKHHEATTLRQDFRGLGQYYSNKRGVRLPENYCQ